VTMKAAVHVHSDWSDDGSWSLEALVKAFARRGYGAVLLAEHDRGWDDDRWTGFREACAAASTKGCLLVPGIEYGDADNVVHVAVWGDLPFLGAGRPTQEILEAAKAGAGISVFAHPARLGAASRFTDEWASLLTGVEVWNRKYDGFAPSRVALQILGEHPRLRWFGGNDFHTAQQFFPLELRFEASSTLLAIHEALSIGNYGARAFGLRLELLARPIPLTLLEQLERLRLRVAVPLRRRRQARAQRR
jgi:hypothetical protein